MKKVLSLVLVMALCISLCGCMPITSLLERLRPTEAETTEAPETTAAKETSVTLPNFENQSLSFAQQWLENADIQVKIEYEYNNVIAEGGVISQSVPAGEKIFPGDTVILTVSKGVEECPYEYSQKLTVSALPGSTQATATLYEWVNGDWKMITAYKATVAKNGIGTAFEGSRRTPQGVYSLGVILTANAIRTNMPTRTVTKNTGVVDDPSSAYYNIIMEKNQVPSGVSFDQIGTLLTNGSVYALIYIEHNGDGISSENVVSGKGSAIGVRGRYSTLSPTNGDVDISHTDMIDLISRLDADKNPVIEITLR